jgi:hypothetical protein
MPVSNGGNNKKHGLVLATKSVENQSIVPVISQPSCERKSGGTTKALEPLRPSSKSTQNKQLPQPAKAIAASTKSYQDGTAHDIDERDADDILSATAYVQDMYKYYSSEEHRAVVGDYMKDQPKLKLSMRAILVDWLCSIHHKTKCEPETLYLTVNIIDRYLAKAEATRKNLQLIGTSALLTASKYEQIEPVWIDDLVFVCDRAYSKDDVSPKGSPSRLIIFLMTSY